MGVTIDQFLKWPFAPTFFLPHFDLFYIAPKGHFKNRSEVRVVSENKLSSHVPAQVRMGQKVWAPTDKLLTCALFRGFYYSKYNELCLKIVVFSSKTSEWRGFSWKHPSFTGHVLKTPSNSKCTSPQWDWSEILGRNGHKFNCPKTRAPLVPQKRDRVPQQHQSWQLEHFQIEPLSYALDHCPVQ